MTQLTRKLVVALLILLLSPMAATQLHKDTKLGFQFKPPKKFEPIALNTREVTVVAKFQSSQAETSQSSVGYQTKTFNSTYQIMFYPNARLDAELTREENIDELWEQLESVGGYGELLKEKKGKIAKVAVIEKHISRTTVR